MGVSVHSMLQHGLHAARARAARRYGCMGDARPRVPGTPACAPAALTGAHFSAALRGSPLWCARGTCSSARGVVRVCLERSGTE